MATIQSQKKLEGPIPIDKERVRAITRHIKNTKSKSNRTAFVIENGKSKEKTAYTLPRELLRLNAYNHRFTTAVDELIEERISTGKSADFDMENTEDVEAIRNMLRGIKPINADRKERYKKILQEIENHSEIHGGNGLKMAGIITADGMYINGNRRDVVLEDLQQKEVKKKGRGDPSKFDTIDVVICDEKITYSDIRQMEITEQVSVSLRDEYDFLSTAMLIQDEYDNLISQKGEDKKDQVIKTLASRAVGKGPNAILEYLEFLEFVTFVLKRLEMPGEYYKINTKIPGETKPVITIVREWQKKWSNAKIGPQKFLFINLASAYCQGVFNTKNDEDDDDSTYNFSSRNHRIFRTYAKSARAKSLMEDSNYWKNHDFTSTKSMVEFGDRVQRANEFKKNESWLAQPVKVLLGISDSLQVIDDALVGSQSREAKTLLYQAKVKGYLNDYKDIIIRIEKKLKK